MQQKTFKDIYMQPTDNKIFGHKTSYILLKKQVN